MSMPHTPPPPAPPSLESLPGFTVCSTASYVSLTGIVVVAIFNRRRIAACLISSDLNPSMPPETRENPAGITEERACGERHSFRAGRGGLTDTGAVTILAIGIQMNELHIRLFPINV